MMEKPHQIEQRIEKQTVALQPVAVVFKTEVRHEKSAEKKTGEAVKKALLVLGDSDLLISSERMNKAIDKFGEGNAYDLILITGTRRECEIMLEVAITRGLELDKVIADDKALNTMDNFRNAAEILLELEIKEVDIVTSRFQAQRAKRYAENALKGLKIDIEEVSGGDHDSSIQHALLYWVDPLILSFELFEKAVAAPVDRLRLEMHRIWDRVVGKD